MPIAKLIEAFGELKTIREWSQDKRCVPKYEILQARLKRGEDIEYAMSRPREKGRAGEDIKVGDKFNRLTIKELISEQKYDQTITFAKAICECGKETYTKLTSIINNHALSCGCWKSEVQRERAIQRNYKHGKANSDYRLYREWCGLNNRYYKNIKVTVCEEWENDFELFEKWSLSNGYNDHLTIDRKNNSLGYSPENCRWISLDEQQRNKTSNFKIIAWKEEKVLSEWGRDSRSSVSSETIRQRILSGWKPELAISTPDRRKSL